MPTDYAQISAENEKKYGTEVSYYGSDFADRYTERTHFIFELLQNAEDALRWREEAEPGHRLPRSVKFVLFADHLEVTHYGLPFNEGYVRAICSIKRGTKHQNLTDIGKFGIGFKSVYAYTKRPEVHSGDEHFLIESYVHPRSATARATQSGQTLFYIPFDHDEIPPEQAHAEISTRLPKLGFRTLLFLNQIESVDWEVSGKDSGSYLRETKQHGDHKEVMLIGQASLGGSVKPLDEQHWLVFARPVTTPKGEPAGKVEVAFKLAADGKSSKRSIVRSEDSNLVVFFPTEKETHCGFLIQGPYKTTPSRDNVPHDNKWNNHLVKETAKLVAETLLKCADLKLASVGLLQAMPLLRSWEIPDGWMFQPVYDAIVQTLKAHPLIPALGSRLVSGQRARIARGKGLADLFAPAQLSLLLGTDQDELLDWVTPEISESRSGISDLFAFLRDVLDVEQIEPDDLPPYLTEEFFQAQPISWMVKLYIFLLDHERLWRRERLHGALLDQPFIRLQDNRHITPFRPDGAPNVYLSGDSETEFDTVHRLLAKPKKCAEFLRKLGLTEPDVTSEVLQKVLPQYESDEVSIPDKKHLTNLRKIFRALGGESPSRTVLVERLRDLDFLRASDLPGKQAGFGKPGELYFRTKQLETFFEQQEDVWFLAEPEELVGRERIKVLLKELGVEDKPRRVLVQTDDDLRKMRELRGGGYTTRDIHFLEYDIHGLGAFLKALKKLDFPEAARRARLLWDFLLRHLEACPPGTENDFFRGEYKWKYYSNHTRHFDAHFLTVLRSKAWLPGKDGELHKPAELLPQEMVSGFTRHPVLCEELQMKAEVLVNLAKEAGIKLEDLVFIRQHREEFEKLKRNVKEKPPANAKPLEPPPPATPAPPSVPAPAGESPPLGPAAPPAPAASSPETPAAPAPVALDEVASAIHALLGTDSAVPTTMPAELDNPEYAPGAERSGTAATPTKLSPGSASGTTTASQPQSDGSRHPDGKHFTYVYVSPQAPTATNGQSGADAEEEFHRREKVGREGVDAVLEYEQKAGRSPNEMPHTHEGYDVESRNIAGEIERYIEVKSISAAWGERGVTLSRPQFSAAQRFQDKYWLYVVENAGSSSPAIQRIQDPALKVNSFAYDHGWRLLAEQPLTAAEPPPPDTADSLPPPPALTEPPQLAAPDPCSR